MSKPLFTTNIAIEELAFNFFDENYSNKTIAELKKTHRNIKKKKNERELIKSHICLGNYYLGQGKLNKALSHYEKGLGLEANQKKKEEKFRVFLYSGVGKCFLEQKKYSEGKQHIQNALELASEVLEPYNPKQGVLYSDLGNCYAHMGEYMKALDCCQTALIKLLPEYEEKDMYDNPKIDQDHLKNYLLEILSNKAYAIYGLYQKSEIWKDLLFAYETFELLDELIHAIRQDYQIENSKLFLASRVHEIYDAALGVAYELYEETRYEKYLEKCFEWAEMGQSYILLRDIRKKEAKIEANIPKYLLNREESLRLELTRIDKFINWEKAKEKGKNNEKIIEKEREYQVYHYSYQKLIDRFEKEYPDYYRLKYDVKIAKVEELRTHLLEDSSCKGSALIEYFVGEEYLYIFFITSEKFEVIRKELSQEFGKAIREFQAAIKKDYYTEKYRYIRWAYQLYQMLFPDEIQQFIENWREGCIEENIVERLIIIPDEELATFPFDALLTRVTKNSVAFNELPYLIRDFPISYHYSTTLWLNGSKKRNSSAITYDGDFIGFAPIYEELESKTRDMDKGLLSSVERYRKKYGRLINSEKEIDDIIRVFEELGYQTKSCKNKEATEANFKELAPKYRYVLVSAHGFYDANHPERAHIVLYPNKEGEGFSHFSMSDAYNLQINAKLVVLSCCETGIGRVVKGEGVMAMNRGFLYAGAENVIYTLFKVYDKHSAELTQSFFKVVLTKKLSYAEALREAKLSMIKREEYKPVHWAGFVLIGD